MVALRTFHESFLHLTAFFGDAFIIGVGLAVWMLLVSLLILTRVVQKD